MLQSIPSAWRRPLFAEKRPISAHFTMRNVLLLMGALRHAVLVGGMVGVSVLSISAAEANRVCPISSLNWPLKRSTLTLICGGAAG